MIRQAIVIAFVGGMAALSAQELTPAGPAFEVASVKANTSGDNRSVYRIPPQGQVSITNAELRRIIARAYEVDPRRERFLLVGGPSDILSARFDITAKPPDDAPAGQNLLMLRRLLMDRFRLRVRPERRETAVYELRSMRTRETLGPRIRPSTHDCLATTDPRPPREVCDTEILRSATERNVFGAAMIVALGIKNAGPFSRLVSDIQAFSDRPVIDSTGITGNYEWHLTAANAGVTASEFPTISSAVEEQLGLKLESTRGPVEVLVIDSVERPTPD